MMSAQVQSLYIDRLKWQSEQSSRRIGLITVGCVAGFLVVGGLVFGVGAVWSAMNPPNPYDAMIQEAIKDASK